MMTRIFIAIGAVIVLAAVNLSIFGKEQIKRDGEVIFLDLTPRDPRSLMQGDYMTLRFRLAQEIETSLRGPGVGRRIAGQPDGVLGDAEGAPREGETRLANITLDEKRIASLAKAGAPATLKVRYRMRNGAVWLGTNAFFFSEGSDRRYGAARYGEFRLDKNTGEAVLVGLRDSKLNAL